MRTCKSLNVGRKKKRMILSVFTPLCLCFLDGTSFDSIPFQVLFWSFSSVVRHCDILLFKKSLYMFWFVTLHTNFLFPCVPMSYIVFIPKFYHHLKYWSCDLDSKLGMHIPTLDSNHLVYFGILCIAFIYVERPLDSRHCFSRAADCIVGLGSFSVQMSFGWYDTKVRKLPNVYKQSLSPKINQVDIDNLFIT